MCSLTAPCHQNVIIEVKNVQIHSNTHTHTHTHNSNNINKSPQSIMGFIKTSTQSTNIIASAHNGDTHKHTYTCSQSVWKVIWWIWQKHIRILYDTLLDILQVQLHTLLKIKGLYLALIFPWRTLNINVSFHSKKRSLKWKTFFRFLFKCSSH